MKKNNINLIWTKKGENHRRKLDRNSFWAIMDSIKNGFWDDNEISSTLSEVVPGLESISIDFDRNAELDVPFIILEFGDGRIKYIEIRRRHRIIWSILEGYCK